MRRTFQLLGAGVVLLLAVVVARTTRFRAVSSAVEPARQLALAGAADRLAGSLRIPTISHEDPARFDAGSFHAFHAYLEAVFPLVHSRLKRETVASYSLLYSWLGTDTTLKPILLIGHQDVVPVEPGSEAQWHAEPFGGRIADGFIWGRGAIDNKSTVVGTLEAVELLLREGFQPRRTVYLAFGHDEEVGGVGGAREIADVLKRRGIELELVLDEGGVIGDSVLPRIASPVAMVGIAEKGFVSIELSTRSAGGHSSLPPRQSTVGILSAAIARLEAKPMTLRLEEPTRKFFERVGPKFPISQRAAFANLWLAQPLVLRNLGRNPATNAMVRTTTAATVFQAGTKDNVLASHARAVVNARILPGDSVASVLEHVRRTIDDQRVEVTKAGRFSAEPSSVSNTDSRSYLALERTIRRVMPDVIVAPYLVVVATDSRHYSGLSDNVFRFLPLRLTPRDIQRMHGTDERVAVVDYEQAIRFYRQLMLDIAGS